MLLLKKKTLRKAKNNSGIIMLKSNKIALLGVQIVMRAHTVFNILW